MVLVGVPKMRKSVVVVVVRGSDKSVLWLKTVGDRGSRRHTMSKIASRGGQQAIQLSVQSRV